MRCYKIQFDGYKRLAETGCNVDGQIIAFVGPNEVGKTSLLQGLEWLTRPDSEPLPFATGNRSRARAEKERVVSATYRLDPADQAALERFDLAEMPVDFYLERHADGTVSTALEPRPRRNPQVFDQALKALLTAERRLAAQLRVSKSDAADDEDEEATPAELVSTLTNVLARPEDQWTDEECKHAQELCEWLREVPSSSRSRRPRDEKAAGLVEQAFMLGGTEHPARGARTIIYGRVPRFVRFSDAERELAMTHNLADEAIRQSPPGALANLLAVAEIDPDELWGYIAQDASTKRETLLRKGNERLKALFTQAWNQAAITVHLNLNGTLLEIMVDELDEEGSRTSVEERSDGLQTFIALVAFLARQNLQIPPILLVDEAETHLHLDAQADLVDVLLGNLDATQVFYTTHSPGCLPRDLGTGIRLIGRDRNSRDASLLKADFWTNKEPGFSSLLFAMGASAAAFSVCRRAVLAEGAADMILLPSMLRKATGLEDIGYQIAPGLSNAHAYDMEVEEVAAQVVYLRDGDQGGRNLEKQLRDSGVRSDRIFALPKNHATEDLLDKDYYIRVVNRLMPNSSGSPRFSKADVNPHQPIGKSLADWGKKTGTHVPGKVAVASAIAAERENIILAPKSAAILLGLHGKFLAALNSKPRAT